MDGYVFGALMDEKYKNQITKLAVKEAAKLLSNSRFSDVKATKLDISEPAANSAYDRLHDFLIQLADAGVVEYWFVPAREYCCENMKQQLEYSCPQHGDGKNCPDVAVFEGKNGARYIEARNATYICTYCPWCGTKHEPSETSTSSCVDLEDD